jgi:hypothetical protein
VSARYIAAVYFHICWSQSIDHPDRASRRGPPPFSTRPRDADLADAPATIPRLPPQTEISRLQLSKRSNRGEPVSRERRGGNRAGVRAAQPHYEGARVTFMGSYITAEGSRGIFIIFRIHFIYRPPLQTTNVSLRSRQGQRIRISYRRALSLAMENAMTESSILASSFRFDACIRAHVPPIVNKNSAITNRDVAI